MHRTLDDSDEDIAVRAHSRGIIACSLQVPDFLKLRFVLDKSICFWRTRVSSRSTRAVNVRGQGDWYVMALEREACGTATWTAFSTRVSRRVTVSLPSIHD